MNKTIVTTVVTLSSLCASAFGQTILNGDFSSVSAGKSSDYTTELGKATASFGGGIENWTTTPSASFVTNEKNTALLIEEGAKAVSSAFKISVAGKYTISFTTFGTEKEATAGIALNGAKTGTFAKENISEKLDSTATNRTFSFEVTEELIKDNGSEFQLEFNNSNGGGLAIDNVSFTPEPSSALLLGFAGLVGLTRRTRK